MIATAVIAIPLAGAALSLLPWLDRAARWIACGAALACGSLAAYAAIAAPADATRAPWILAIGATYAVEVDGLAAIFLAETGILFAVAAAASARVPDRRAYFALFGLLLACVDGAIVARDLLLFFVFWQSLLVPLVILVLRWGGVRRRRAVRRFVAHTLAADALLLVAIVSLAAIRGSADIDVLAGRPLPAAAQLLPMLLVLVALAMRLGVFPLHGWVAPLRAAAPLPVALVLVPALALVSVSAVVRVCTALFPDALGAAAPALVALASVGSVYTALLATRQQDVRRLVAYAALSQQNLVALGLFAATATSVAGAAVLSVSLGLTVGVLLLAVRAMAPRASAFTLSSGGGLSAQRGLAALATLAVAAAIGVPGTAGFAGTLLVLAGVYGRYPVAAGVAVVSFFVAAVYGLGLIRRALHGPPVVRARDLRRRDWLLAAPLLVALIVVGVAPALLTDRLPAELVPAGAER